MVFKRNKTDCNTSTKTAGREEGVYLFKDSRFDIRSSRRPSRGQSDELDIQRREGRDDYKCFGRSRTADSLISSQRVDPFPTSAIPASAALTTSNPEEQLTYSRKSRSRQRSNVMPGAISPSRSSPKSREEELAARRIAIENARRRNDEMSRKIELMMARLETPGQEDTPPYNSTTDWTGNNGPGETSLQIQARGERKINYGRIPTESNKRTKKTELTKFQTIENKLRISGVLCQLPCSKRIIWSLLSVVVVFIAGGIMAYFVSTNPEPTIDPSWLENCDRVRRNETVLGQELLAERGFAIILNVTMMEILLNTTETVGLWALGPTEIMDFLALKIQKHLPKLVGCDEAQSSKLRNEYISPNRFIVGNGKVHWLPASLEQDPECSFRMCLSAKFDMDLFLRTAEVKYFEIVDLMADILKFFDSLQPQLPPFISVMARSVIDKNSTMAPSSQPTVHPSELPMLAPTVPPSRGPMVTPPTLPTTVTPTPSPTTTPTTLVPTTDPTPTPTSSPTMAPSESPSTSSGPTLEMDGYLHPLTYTVPPTPRPTYRPTVAPTASPTTRAPTLVPSVDPTLVPSINPSLAPTIDPTPSPTRSPTITPSIDPTTKPTRFPTMAPSDSPSTSSLPTSLDRTNTPSLIRSAVPSQKPTELPSNVPTVHPTATPTHGPTATPTPRPTLPPTPSPTTTAPTLTTTLDPTLAPTLDPTPTPTKSQTVAPVDRPLRIACAGDSLTKGTFGAQPWGTSYPFQLQQMLGENFEVYNFGRNSVTALRGLSVSYVSTAQFRASLNLEPDIYLLMLGTNDAKYWEAHGHKYHGDMEWIVDKVRSISMGSPTRIIVAIPPWVKTDAYGIRNDVLVSSVQPVIQSLVALEELQLVNMYDVTYNQADSFLGDGLHLNKNGNGSLAAAWKVAIQCNQNGICEAGENCVTCPADCYLNCL